MCHRASVLVPATVRRFSFLLCVLLLGLATARPTHAALIGYWNFDEGSGTNATDTSGRVGPLNGMLSASGAGAVVPAWIAGRFGTALDFNQGTAISAGGLVTVPYNGDLRLSNAFTISFWWRPDYTPAASTFPGIVRIGSQSAVPPAANAGWGFFRPQANTPTFKRGNHQPAAYAALTTGNWHHLALIHDGLGTNVAFMNGTPVTFITNWPALTTTAVLEFGRMDAFDNAALDDFALFNERITPAKTRSLYTLPTALSLNYDLATMRQLWTVFDGGPGSSGVVGGATWYYTNSLPGSTNLGDSYISGTRWYVVLSNNVGVTATATLLGDLSPNGVGLPGTTTYPETPVIGSTARFVFDLNTTTAIGGGTNDLFEITGDLNLAGQSVVVNPMGILATGTYRLINYTGAKTGSLNPAVLGNTRYTLTLDESVPGQIDLIVSGSPSEERWVSLANVNWNVTTTNWINVGSGLPDLFFQGDAATFNDATAYQSNITVALPVYPHAVTVNSATINYSIGGAAIGGMSSGLTKSGASQLTLSGPNNFLGPVTVNEGALRLGSSTALGRTNSGTTIAPGATLDLAGFAIGTERITVGGAGVNNAGAILNSGGGLANNGLNGAVTLTGDTTLGGNSRFDIFGGSLAGGGYSLTKTGTAEIALSNLRDTGLGNIEIQSGQLTILGSTTLGDPTRSVTVRTNAVLAHWASGTNRHDKPLILQQARLVNATSPADNATNIAAISITGSNTLEGTSSLTLLGAISGAGSLTKLGAGTATLGGTNLHTGNTTVSGGSLALIGEGSIASSPLVTLGSGTRLIVSNRVDGTFTVANGQTLAGAGIVDGSLSGGTGATVSPGFSAGTLAVSNALSLTGDATLVYELSALTNAGGGINDLINVGGALNLSGSNVIRVLPTGPLDTVTPYTLINYAGALTGDSNNLTAVSDTRASFEVDTASTPGKVLLKVTNGAPLTLTWLGFEFGAETLWDLQTTPNWFGGGPQQFYSGDTAVFDDTAAGFTVDVTSGLYPALMRVEANVNDYLFTGTGRLRGGSLLKSQSGKLTIANSGLNDYPGPTTISGGTIQLGTGGTVGNLGPNVVTNNGRLIYNRSDDFTVPNTIFGTGTLEKQGPNILTAGAQLVNFNGPIEVQAGMLKPTAFNSLGLTNQGTAIANGGTFDLAGFTFTNEQFTVGGAGVSGNGAIINSGAAQTFATRFISLSADATFGGTNRWDVRGQPTAVFNGNNRALTKTGPNEVWLVEAGETALGAITVNQGTLGFQGSTTMGDPAATATFNAGTTLGIFAINTNVLTKPIALNGASILNNSGTNTIGGPVTITGSNTLSQTAHLTFTNVIGGPGGFNKIGAGTNFMLNDNAYAGGTLVTAGSLFLGNNTPQGSVSGNILLAGGNLFFARTNPYTLAANIAGTAGNIFVRSHTPDSALTIDGTAGINAPGVSFDIGRDVYGKVVLNAGAQVAALRVSLGNIAGTVGEVVQNDGDVTVVTDARVGHWPGAISTYFMNGGTLNLTNIPTAVVNQNAVAEQGGILYLGIDGTGVFTQTGGEVRAHGVVLDGRGETAGTDTLNLNGGILRLGASALKSGNLGANTSYAVNLGGGTLAFSANSTSTLAMTLTAGSTIETTGTTNILTGAIGGGGGLTKTGPGVLILTGTNNYSGLTDVSGGTLVVLGSIGALASQVSVNNGVLAGNGTINDLVEIFPGGTVAPGLSVGVLTVYQAAFSGGTAEMELSKTGLVTTNDRLAAVDAMAFGGTLNVTASGDALAAGDTFDLFDATEFFGQFDTVNLPALGPNLLWDTTDLYVTGVIRVINDTPPSLSFSFSGGTLTLSWPPGYGSFVLQAQTNAPGLGIDTNWTTILSGTNYLSAPVDTNAGSVFFRLIAP